MTLVHILLTVVASTFCSPQPLKWCKSVSFHYSHGFSTLAKTGKAIWSTNSFVLTTFLISERLYINGTLCAFWTKKWFCAKNIIQGALKASYLLLFCSISETLHFFTFFDFFSHFCSKYHFETVAKTKLFVAFLMPLVIACWFCDFLNIFWFFSVFWCKNHAPLHIVQKSNK